MTVQTAEETASAGLGFDRDETIKLAEGDLNFLAGISIPDIFKYFFPAIFIAIWQLICDAVRQERGLLRLAFGIPRGFAKTAFLKIYVVFVILFTKRNFILVVCNTEPLAHNFLADVFDILESPNIISLFGDYRLGLEKNTQGIKKFGFRGRDIIVAGIGVGTSLRGLNLKFRRPDVIIMDDMQSREDAENPTTAKNQLIWMMGTLMKARNYERCLFIFVGNMYPFEGSILRKLKYNPQWISFICGAILADGESLWPEFRPVPELLAELEHDISMGHPEVFYSEVLNDEEAGTVSGIDVSKIPPYPPHLDHIEPQAGCIIIDPASGKKDGNDVAIGAFYIFDGTPVFWRVEADKFDPLTTIQTAIRMAMELRIKCICVESNAYQHTLLWWFDFACKQLGIEGITFCELYAGNLSKNTKIKNMLNGMIEDIVNGVKKKALKYLHPSVRSKFIYQVTHWNPLKLHNTDDILDLVAWVDTAVALYGEFMELTGFVSLNELSKDPMPPGLVTPAELQTSF